MGKRTLWYAVFALSAAAAFAEDRPLRLEGVGTFHYNGSAQAEYAFVLGSSALALDGGVSYGTRDWWNSLSAGTSWYPLSPGAEGPFVQVQETYGFGVQAVQNDSGRDWKTAATLGYRWVAFGWLTGSFAAGVNYDALIVAPSGRPSDFNSPAQKGFNPAVTISLGMAFDPRP